jgi:hypothetical protein
MQVAWRGKENNAESRKETREMVVASLMRMSRLFHRDGGESESRLLKYRENVKPRDITKKLPIVQPTQMIVNEVIT